MHCCIMNWAPVRFWSVVDFDRNRVFSLVHKFVESSKVILADWGHETLVNFGWLFPVVLPYWRFVYWVAFPFLSLFCQYPIIYWDEIVRLWAIGWFWWFFNEFFHCLLFSGVNNKRVVSVNNKILSILKRIFFKLLLKIVFMDLFEHLFLIEFNNCDFRLVWANIWSL